MYFKCTKCNSVFSLSDEAIALLSYVSCPFCGNLAEDYNIKIGTDTIIKFKSNSGGDL